jgi:UDP-glucose-4-epimerase GalE
MEHVTAVTGGGGYVGTHTVKYLLETTQDKIVVLDSFERSDRQFIDELAKDARYRDRLKVRQVALEDKDAVSKALSEEKVTDVVHCAAYIEVPEGQKEPDLYRRKILDNSRNLLAAMKENGVGRLVFSGTAAAFGPPQQDKVDLKGRITEEHPRQASTNYGLYKVEVEGEIRKAAAEGWLSAVVFNYFNVAGADREGKIGEAHLPKETHALPLIILKGLGLKKNFKIMGTDLNTPDHTPVRDLIHVSDLAAAHTNGLEHMRAGRLQGVNFYNLGSGEGVSVRQMADAVRRTFKRMGLPDFEVEEQREKRDPSEPDVLVASSAKAERELGWSRRHSLDDIVETAVKWTLKLAQKGWYNRERQGMTIAEGPIRPEVLAAMARVETLSPDTLRPPEPPARTPRRNA